MTASLSGRSCPLHTASSCNPNSSKWMNTGMVSLCFLYFQWTIRISPSAGWQPVWLAGVQAAVVVASVVVSAFLTVTLIAWWGFLTIVFMQKGAVPAGVNICHLRNFNHMQHKSILISLDKYCQGLFPLYPSKQPYFGKYLSCLNILFCQLK